MLHNGIRRTLVAVFATLLCLFSPLSAYTAEAAGVCQSYELGHYFDGFIQSANATEAFEGVSSYIYPQNGALCSGSTVAAWNYTNAWVMITGRPGPEVTYDVGWGQVGFERTVGYPTRWFSQFNDGFRNFRTRYSSFPVDGEFSVRHAFFVTWGAGCHCLQATIDTTPWASSEFNPFNPQQSRFGAQPWSPQFLGETGYVQTDIPGVPTKKVLYTGMGAQRYVDDQLESMPCTLASLNDFPDRWGLSASGCTSFTIWTK